MTKFLKPGIPGLDTMIGEGIPDGSSIIVEGGPGSGKTTFCLQISQQACNVGLKVLYLSFEEPESKLRRNMTNFGWNPELYEKKGLFQIRRLDALEMARNVEALLTRKTNLNKTSFLIPQGFLPHIICIDSLSSISSAFSGEEYRFRIYMEQFFRYLEKHNIRSFLIRETAIPTHIGLVYVEAGEAISFLSDGIIVLYNVIYPHGRRGRAIEILKLRGADIDRKIVEAEIKNGIGLKVYPKKLLTGVYKLT